MGKKEKKNGSTFLNDVYAYIVYDGKHGFTPLPGKPKSICIDNASFIYDIDGGEIEELYDKHIKREEDSKKSIVMPDSQIIVSH